MLNNPSDMNLYELTYPSHLTANHMLSMGCLLVADRKQFLAMGLVYKIHYTNKYSYLSRYFQNVKDEHQHQRQCYKSRSR